MQVLTEGAGFGTIVIGTFLLHSTKDLEVHLGSLGQLAAAPPRENGHSYAELPLQVPHLWNVACSHVLKCMQRNEYRCNAFCWRMVSY